MKCSRQTGRATVRHHGTDVGGTERGVQERQDAPAAGAGAAAKVLHGRVVELAKPAEDEERVEAALPAAAPHARGTAHKPADAFPSATSSIGCVRSPLSPRHTPSDHPFPSAPPKTRVRVRKTATGARELQGAGASGEAALRAAAGAATGGEGLAEWAVTVTRPSVPAP